MAGEALRFPPFPPLSWDGWYWRAPLEAPWYRGGEAPKLIVRPDYYSRSAVAGPTDVWSAPRPTESQAAAFRLLTDPDLPLRLPLLAEFQRYVPELAGADWGGVEAFFELATVLIFHPALDGVSYVGLVFNCLRWWEYGYEHGVGIVAHRDRVVYFGMAGEAQDETQALKDLRRIARRSARHGGGGGG